MRQPRPRDLGESGGQERWSWNSASLAHLGERVDRRGVVICRDEMGKGFFDSEIPVN